MRFWILTKLVGWYIRRWCFICCRWWWRSWYCLWLIFGFWSWKYFFFDLLVEREPNIKKWLQLMVNLRLLVNFLTVSDILQAFSELWVKEALCLISLSSATFTLSSCSSSMSSLISSSTRLILKWEKCCWMIQSKEFALVCFKYLFLTSVYFQKFRTQSES